MHRILRKIHMYIGLLSFSILVVYGIAGLTATFQVAPEARRRLEPAVRFEPFKTPLQASDKEVADLVYRQVAPPLSSPLPEWAYRHDADNNLLLNFYSVNGLRAVTVLEKQNQLRIETARNSIWHYFGALHTVTPNRGTQLDLRTRLWAWYNEVSIFTLLAMAVSGILLWWTSRPRFLAAQVSVAAGFGIFAALYFLTR